MTSRTVFAVIAFTTLVLIAGLSSRAQAAESDDRKTLVGTWKITVFQDDGRDRLDRLGAGLAKKDQPPRVAKLVFTADECWVIRGDGKRELKAGLANAAFKAVKLDPGANPKTIDITGFSGKEADATKTYQGIYSLEDKTLRICWCEQGNTRPTKLESDGANNLFVCEKISDEPQKPAE